MLTLSHTRHWRRTTLRCMGTAAELLIDGEAHHIPMACARLRALERRWSRFRPDSELNQAQAAPGRWVTVSPDLARAIRAALHAHHVTGGAFDPTVRAALEALGYDRTFPDIADAASRGDLDQIHRKRAPAPGPGDVELDGQRLRLHGAVSLDLGGIGKGLAADMVSRELIATGARAALVSLGGDMCAAGEPPDGGWPVPIVHPTTGVTLDTHHLRDGALVMSTTLLRTWWRDGARHHHIIDPRTGASTASDLAAVAVAGPSAAQAEAVAKAAIVLGHQPGRVLVERLGLEAWFIEAER